MSRLRLRLVARRLPREQRRSGFLVASVAGHVALLGGLLLYPTLRPARSSSLPAIEVVMLAPAAESARPQTSARTAPPPAPPEQEAAPPETSPETVRVTPPEPTPAPPQTAEKPEPPRRPTEQEPRPTPRETFPPQPAGGDPEADAEGDDYASDTAASGIQLAGMGAEFDWYRDAVIRSLHASWRQPAVGEPAPLQVTVGFEILRDGSVRAIRVLESSGASLLDRSAVRAVQDATLPPLPRDHREPTQPARFVFRLFPDRG